MKAKWVFTIVTLGISIGIAGCGNLVSPSASETPPLTTKTESPSTPSSAPTTEPANTPNSTVPTPLWIPAAKVSSVVTKLLSNLHTPCQIQVEMYELGNPNIVQSLIQDHKMGCNETIELDGTESQSMASGRTLASAGIDVKFAHIANNGIDHIKALVIDGGATDLVGGVNWGQYSSDTQDADVLLFNDPSLATRLTIDFGNLTSNFAGGITNNEELNGPSINAAMLQLINNAQHHILITTNYLTSYSIQDALASAVQRGVTVQVLLNPQGYGASAAATWLTDHKIQVRYAPESPYLHAKIILTDTSGIIGSANLSYDGLNVNRELDVIVPTSLLSAANSWADTLWQQGTAAS